ncbi:MAG: hypothetical protein HQK63_16050 [Desulfamplus sp.]|nr:hypothetical protein [Desulfamplus sp.]
MKLSNWARQNNITYRTAWEHFRTGKIPNAYKLESGTIIVPDENITIKPEYVVTYARVSGQRRSKRKTEQIIKDLCCGEENQEEKK